MTEGTSMTRRIERSLFACLCGVFLLSFHCHEASAQRKLVPVVCNDNERSRGVVCLDSLFVEEGTIPPDSCEYITRWHSQGDASTLKLLFTNFFIQLSFTGSDEHAAEYKELSGARGVIDGSNSYLLNDQVRGFLALLKQSVGYDVVVADGIAPSNLSMGGPFTFHVTVPGPNHYNYWTVMQLWAAVRGVDTSDVYAVREAQSSVEHGTLFLAEPCLVLASAIDEDTSVAHNTPRVCHGEIQLPDVQGRYTLFDLNGSVVWQGEVLPGEVTDGITVGQGLYVLVSSHSAQTILVLP